MNSKKILVSDFEERHSQAIIHTLRNAGYQIISFSNNLSID